MIGVGLMSGTSVDAIDAAVVRLSEAPVAEAASIAGVASAQPLTLTIDLLHYQETPIDEALRRRVHGLFQPDTSRVDDLCEVNVLLGEAFAQAAAEALDRSGLAADFVASHGQTVWHETRPDRSRS